MRHIVFALLGAAALSFASLHVTTAADMSAKAPMYTKAPVAVPAYNWTGWYVGANAGYGWSASTDPGFSLSDTSGTGYAAYVAAGGFSTPSLNPKGVLGGLQVGYNFQQANLVWGAEADLQAAGLTDSSTVSAAPTAVIGTTTVEHALHWFGTLRGRAGVAMNNWLFYGTGGLIYGGVHSTLTQSATNGYFAAATSDTTRAGWTVGAGTEMGWGMWTAKLEYLYFDMGRDSVTVLGTGVFTGISYTASQRTAGSMVRLGLNYRF